MAVTLSVRGSCQNATQASNPTAMASKAGQTNQNRVRRIKGAAARTKWVGRPDSFMHVAARLDLVAVGIADEGAVIIGMVFGPEARAAVFGPALFERGEVEGVDLRARLGAEGDVHA